MSDNEIIISAAENITIIDVEEISTEVVEEIITKAVEEIQAEAVEEIPTETVEEIITKAVEEIHTETVVKKHTKPIVFNKQALISELLIDILVKNDDIKDFADRITIKINNQALVILKKILSKAPEALDKVVDNLTDILSDGVIDHKDIPKMIILVSNLYKTDLKSIISSQGLTTTEVVEFIQFVIKLVIDLGFVHVNDKVQIFEIIEASGALLEMVIPSQEIKCTGLFSLFTCCKKPVVNP
jgi:hypothetical protein